MGEKHTCSVRDRRFVEPCDGLESLIDNIAPGFSRKKGIFSQSLSNFKTGEPTRRMIGVKCEQYPNGLLFNFCPVCGTNISAPFMDKDEAA